MFTIEDRVRGKEGTEFEFAECMVIDTDGDGNVQIVVVEHEYDPMQDGDEEWVDGNDLRLISTGNAVGGTSITAGRTFDVPEMPSMTKAETLLILGEI